MSKNLSQSTIDQYQYYIDKYNELDLNEPELTIKYLYALKKSQSYVKAVISAILWHLRTEKADKSIISKYTREVSKLLAETKKQEIDHTRTAENIPEWSDIRIKRQN